ncbi:HtaA domain-containing protein [Corynebacterium choanae]|uniref:Htaa n=1 Tax=Corynebacterium choanae TaxID=1862358 RepID=A0A3G6J3C3_9CORY|nr:HtaA domain-containing protein [Corynebacterium choanae]AZA12571.1 Htaa [Corynebacterium choanae]
MVCAPSRASKQRQVSNQSRRLLAATATTLLVAGGVLLPIAGEGAVVPVAAAADCSDPYLAISGEMTWGVKESFLKYVTGPIAKGSYSTSGAAKQTATGFSFPLKQSYVESGGDEGVLAGSGTVQFSGHGGKLATTFTAPIITFTRADEAMLSLEVTSQDPEGKPVAVSGKRVDFATVRFSAPLQGTGSYQGEVSLTSAGATAFADFYEPGTLMDPLVIEVTGADSRCGKRPTASNSGGSTAASTKYDLDTGHPGLDALGLLNSYLSAGNSAIENSLKIVDNIDKITARQNPHLRQPGAASGASAPGGSGAAVPEQGSAVRPGQPAAASGTPQVASVPGTSSGSTQPGAAPAAVQSGGGADGQQCQQVTQSAIAWGVKTSFRSYITGSIAKGSWSLSGVSERGGVFQFAGSGGSFDPAQSSGTLTTTGEVRFSGHGGILDLRLSDPAVVIAGSTGQLVATVSSQDTSGNPRDYGRVVLATIAVDELQTSDDAVSGSGQVYLTEVGAQAFGDFYEPGTALDPIRFQARLGEGSSCTTGVFTGAATGAAGGSSAGALQAAAGRNSGTAATTERSTVAAGTAEGLDLLDGQEDASGTDVRTGRAFGQRGDGKVTFHSADTTNPQGSTAAAGADTLTAASVPGRFSPWQYALITIAFVVAAAACVGMARFEQLR